jgi:hypothetical protein
MEYNNIQPTTQPTLTTPPSPTPIQPQFNKQKAAKAHFGWIVWLLVIAVILFATATGYLWWKLDDMTQQRDDALKAATALQAQVNSLKKTTVTTCDDSASDALKTNIKTALDTKNLTAFSGYITSPVEFVVAASSKGGSETSTQAVSDMALINSATGPWDFNLPDSTVSAYKAGSYAKYFDENTYVGKAASGQVIAFNFDCSDKINQIFIAASEDLLK